MKQQDKLLILFLTATTIGAISFYFLLRMENKRFSPFKRRLVALANQEWELFGKAYRNADGNWISGGNKEYEDEMSKRVHDYWKEGTNLNYTGKDRDYPWSAAFISFLMKKAQPTLGFKFAPSHSTYIRDAVSNKKSEEKKADFVAYKIDEQPVEVGDLVCYSRESTTDLYDRDSAYKSHCDLVVAKSTKDGVIEVIGGNVADTVAKRQLSIDKNGFLADRFNKWFAIIKNNA